jgi:hypothetical protein
LALLVPVIQIYRWHSSQITVLAVDLGWCLLVSGFTVLAIRRFTTQPEG